MVLENSRLEQFPEWRKTWHFYPNQLTVPWVRSCRDACLKSSIFVLFYSTGIPSTNTLIEQQIYNTEPGKSAFEINWNFGDISRKVVRFMGLVTPSYAVYLADLLLVSHCSAETRNREQTVWRRERDSNPRYVAVYTLSRRAPSTTRTPLRIKHSFREFQSAQG